MSQAGQDEALDLLLEELTPKQRKWAEAYAGEACGNGTRAAEMAGYSGSYSTLAVQAHQNLRNPKIRKVLEALQESDPLIAGRVERLRLLAQIARGDMTDEKLDSKGSRIELRASVKDRLAAIKALAEAAGEHIQRANVEVTGLPEGATIAQLLELAAAGKRGE